ncbi:MAG TPA: hypothetical protein VLX68_09935 [Chitinivibrionales bacterium]|nr:hypothetical protein [Chitinivibrionales bacterium]
MKSIKILSIAAGAVVLAAAAAQGDPWKIDLDLNLTTGVNSYSDNWVGGEAGSFNWGSQFLGIAEKQITAITNTRSTLKLQFGQTAVQNKDTKQWGAPQKSTDLIDFEELFRFTLHAWVDPFISVRGISEFLDGSDTLLTRYVNPWDVTEAVGASRTLQKNDNVEWTTRLGAAVHQLVDRQHLDTATGTRATDVTNDGGAEFDMDLRANNREKWVEYLGSLRVYEALLSSKANAAKGTPAENDWRYPHVKWENTLTLTFAKYLMLNMSAYVYYDKDISKDARLKETFAAGVTYVYSKK